MRLSIDENDPDYGPLALDARVFLDGAELNCCITADEDNGECLCFVVDNDGRLPAPDANGRSITETRRGIVEIVLPT